MWSAALVAGGWLVGCASDTPDKTIAETNQQTPIPSLEEFTTVGKPTKTIETPNGPVEIYDPAQDPEVRAAFNVVYARGDVTFGDVSRYNAFFRTGPYPAGIATGNDPIKETEIVRRAREIHYNDMMRIGCRFIRTKPPQSYGRSHLKAPCEDSRMGDLSLSKCEINSLETNMEVGGPTLGLSEEMKEELRPKVRRRILREESYPVWQNKEPYNQLHIVLIGSIPILQGRMLNIPTLYIGEISEVSKTETFKLLTSIECETWNEKFETHDKP